MMDPISVMVNNLTTIILVLVITVVASIIAITLITVGRTSRASNELAPTNMRLGYVAEEEEQLPPTRSLEEVSMEVLKRLSEFEEINYNDLLSGLDVNREEASRILKDLADQELVEVRGDYVLITDRGRRLLELLREKLQYRRRLTS